MKQADLIQETHDYVIKIEEHITYINGKLIEHSKALESHEAQMRDQDKEIAAQKEKVSKMTTWYVVRGWALAVAAFVIGLLFTKIEF